MSADAGVRQFTPTDLPLMDGLLTTFGTAFGDERTYGVKRPAVDEAYRRQGIATALIEELKTTREDVLYFDIVVPPLST